MPQIYSLTQFLTCRDISRWVLDGFNACMTIFGEQDNDRNQVVFGSLSSGYQASGGDHGLIACLLKDLFAATEHKVRPTESRTDNRKYNIALSAWAVTSSQDVIEYVDDM